MLFQVWYIGIMLNWFSTPLYWCPGDTEDKVNFKETQLKSRGNVTSQLAPERGMKFKLSFSLVTSVMTNIQPTLYTVQSLSTFANFPASIEYF